MPEMLIPVDLLDAERLLDMLDGVEVPATERQRLHGAITQAVVQAGAGRGRFPEIGLPPVPGHSSRCFCLTCDPERHRYWHLLERAEWGSS